MGNVYEVKVKREVYITDYIQVDETLDIENEEVKEILRQTYCLGSEKNTNVKHLHISEEEIVSLEFEKSNEKPQKIFTIEGEGHHEDVYDEDGDFLDTNWVVDKKVGNFSNQFTPENTKSVLYYREYRFRRTTKLPNSHLYFPFSIEKDELEKLWEKGHLNKLSQYLIQPTEQIQRNSANTHIKIVQQLGEKIDANNSRWFAEMYKRKDLETVEIGFFTNDGWETSDFLPHSLGRETGFYNERPFGS